MRSLAALVMVLAAAGCDDAVCHEGQAHCVDEHHREHCSQGTDPVTDPYWETMTCPDWAPVCTDAPTGVTLCAAQADPYPACPQGSIQDDICDGDRAVGCEDGLAVRIDDCPGACFVADSGAATCSLLPEPDPLCTTEKYVACADAQTLIECTDGWRTGEEQCNTEGGCVEFDAPDQYGRDGHRAVCSLAAERDPMCGAGIYDGYCPTRRTGVTCWDGYVIYRFECEARDDGSTTPPPCYDHGDWVSCTTDYASQEGSPDGR